MYHIPPREANSSSPSREINPHPTPTYGTQFFISFTTNCLLEIHINFTYTCTLRFPNWALSRKSPPSKQCKCSLCPLSRLMFFRCNLRLPCPKIIHISKVVWVQCTQIFTYFYFCDRTISNNRTKISYKNCNAGIIQD
jgi:hypothetical protein